MTGPSLILTDSSDCIQAFFLGNDGIVYIFNEFGKKMPHSAGKLYIFRLHTGMCGAVAAAPGILHIVVEQ